MMHGIRAWPCVHWLVSSDDAHVVTLARRAHGDGDAVLWYEGSVAHIDNRHATDLQLLKVLSPPFLPALIVGDIVCGRGIRSR